MPVYQIDQYANTILGQSLSTVPGVGQVSIGGQQQPAVTVQVDPEALASRGLSLAAVQAALSAATLDNPKGNLEGRHQQFTLDTNDQLFSASNSATSFWLTKTGAPVTVKDVATVIDSSVNPRSGAWFDGKPCELLLIYREAGANTVQVVDQIEALLPQLEKSIPRAVHVDLLSDRSQTIRGSVSDVERTLMLTIVLVVLIIFAFLRTLWAVAIPSVTVPLAIVTTFGAMYLFGYSIDNLSLMGRTIAVGFVVDDAIVMIENIVRYIEAGDFAFEAAIKGAGQIGFTIISITFSLIAVFIPLLFMSGIVGRLFHEFAMTVGSIAVVTSALIALTLTPMLCSLFLVKEHERPPGRIGRAFEKVFDRTVAGYDTGLNWVFQHQLFTLLSTIALVALTGYLYVIIPKGFFPEQDTGFLFGQLEAREDSSFESIARMGNEVSQIIQRSRLFTGWSGLPVRPAAILAKPPPACSSSCSLSDNGRQSNRRWHDCGLKWRK